MEGGDSPPRLKASNQPLSRSVYWTLVPGPVSPWKAGGSSLWAGWVGTLRVQAGCLYLPTSPSSPRPEVAFLPPHEQGEDIPSGAQNAGFWSQLSFVKVFRLIKRIEGGGQSHLVLSTSVFG